MNCNKEKLRKKYISLRNGLTIRQIEEKSEKIINNIISLDAFKNAKTIMIYSSIGSEANLKKLPLLKQSEGKCFAYPVCTEKRKMEAYIPTKFKAGAYGILEPDISCSDKVDFELIDLVICPGVAFSKNLARLGMGGGYYDNFLPKCKNAIVLMAAFEIQKSCELKPENHDFTMDLIVTEEKIYKGENL